jgi:predicted AAA+ superfamily ATPase
MIPRIATSTLTRLAKGFPVIALTGPRQSGKTTLAKHVFPNKTYVSLENPEELEFAQKDPKRFLARFKEGAILDEVQRCPSLLSWLQGLVDERSRMGDFVLTGSSQFELVAGITQSLAGRVGRVELLPLSIQELAQAHQLPSQLNTCLLQGGYPSIYDRQVSPQDWFSNYIATYIERDVRQLIAVRDLTQFQRFVKMCAARSGQILNLAALGADCGLSASTAREWLSVLEASYLVTRIQPYYQNFGKRLVKTPKLYFLDVGLMAWLIGIRDTVTLDTHVSRGALFETFVVSELIKRQYNQGQNADLYFWRDSIGNEIDLLLDTPQGLQAIEIKSGSTFASDWIKGFKVWKRNTQVNTLIPRIIYGGTDSYDREGHQVMGWPDIGI